jgi:hypothetical protein
MKPLLSILTLMALLTVAWSGPSLAQTSTVDYLGFGWEDGTFPPSNPGDELQFTGVATALDPLFGVDLSAVEVTFHVFGLISTGEFVDPGTGNTIVGYVGGMLEIYSDPLKNADWGINPPNPTSPSTFSDGLLLFEGSFTDFTLIMTPAGAGAYEGNLDGLAGAIVGAGCTGCAYTWGGAFTSDIGAQIPEGYDLQADGVFEVDNAVSTEATGWGALKARFSN